MVFAEHASALAMLADRLRLVGIAEVDLHRRRAATDAFFVPYCTNDYRELVERPDVDVVVVCTPPSRHGEVVAAALAAGKVVVCEKPLAPNLSSIDRITALGNATPERLSTVYQWRYRPEVRRIIHLRDHGRLGRLVLGRFQRFARIPAGHERTGWWGRWDSAGGGAVMTQAIHEIDLMLHIFGPVREVDAHVATLSLPIESEDTAFATLRFESGAMAILAVSVATHDAATQFDVIGDEAGVHFPWRVSAKDERTRRQLLTESLGEVPGTSRLAHPEVLRVRNKLGQYAPRLSPPKPPPLHLGYWNAVADSLDNAEPLPIGLAEARRSVELVTAIYTSALVGRPVTLPLAPDTPFYAGVSKVDFDRREARNGAAVLT